MTDVTLPDGSIASFPDSMSDQDITGAIQAHLGTAQMGGAARLPALVGSNVAKGALEGVGAIGDLQDWLGGGVKRYLFDPVNNAVQNALGVTGDFSPRPTTSPFNSSHLVGLGRQLGVVDRPDLVPQNTGERFTAAASEGAGGALPYLPLAGGNYLVSGARGLAQGAGAGAAGEAAAEALPDHPDLARAGGALLGAYGTGKLFNAGNRVANAMAGASTPTLDAYRNLGIAPTLAGDVTGSPTLQMMQAYAAKAPGGAGRVHAASEQAVGQWGRALEDTADMLGGSRTLQEAGNALQLEGRSWLDRFKNASRQAWNQVDMAIPPTTPVPLRNYGNALLDIQDAMPNAPATAQKLQPALSRDLLDSLLQDTRAGPLTWQDARAIRTRIGEKLAEPMLVGDTSHAELKRLYGALTDDLQSAAAARGPAAQAAFADAADLTRQGHAFIDNVLSRVLKGDKISPENAASTALGGAPNGGTLLSDLRAQMPRAADELAAYKLRDMGAANAGKQDAAATRVSPGTFVTDRAKLAPEAIDALFGADPDVARRLEDLATVGSSMKATEGFLNNSNTGAHGSTAHALGSFIGAPLAAFEGYHAGGWPAAIAGAFGPAALAYGPSMAASRLVTSPRLTGLLAAPPAAIPQSAGLLATGAAYPQLRGLLSGATGQP